MDWVTRLIGTPETDYATTRSLLEVRGSLLLSKPNGKAYRIGTFEMPSLADLRERVAGGAGTAGKARINIVQADEIGCDIITVTHDLLKKLPGIGKDLDQFSLETVKMFHSDAETAGYTI